MKLPQFTLRQLLLATFIFALGCAALLLGFNHELQAHGDPVDFAGLFRIAGCS
jgi:hypothetical protein